MSHSFSTNSSSPIKAVLLILSFAFLSYVTLSLFETFPSLGEDPSSLILVSVVILTLMAVLSLYGPNLVVSSSTSSSLANAKSTFKATTLTTSARMELAFMLFAVYTAAIDLVLTFNLVGVTKLGAFYFEHGEEYFKCPWGVGVLMWDGICHTAVQGLIAYCILIGNGDGKMATNAKLFWAGSVLNSLPVLLLGAATGEYSDRIKPATALNYPYVVIPLAILVNTLFNHTQTQIKPASSASKGKSANWALVLLELLFIVGNGSLLCFDVLRALGVLNSNVPAAVIYSKILEPEILLPNNFTKVQIMQNVLLLSYWRLLAIYESLVRLINSHQSGTLGGSRAMNGMKINSIAVFVAGVSCQAQFGHFFELFFKFKYSSANATPLKFIDRGDLLSVSNVAVLLNLAWLLLPCVQAVVWNWNLGVERKQLKLN